MTDASTNARIRRELLDLAHRYFQPGANPDDAAPVIQQLSDTYGRDAVLDAAVEIKSFAGQPIHRF